MPLIQYVTIPINRAKPAPYNPRKDLTPEDLEYRRIDKSIDRFGPVEPIVWNERTGHIVGGHQRYKILVARGETEIQVVRVDLSLEEEKALNLALNKAVGAWDEDKLAALLDEFLTSPDLDLEFTGFEFDEARDLVEDVLRDAGQGTPETASVEDLLARGGVPVTQLGDLIELGEHRLLCGDATDPEHIRTLMDGHRAPLFATDPPYLVGYDGSNHPCDKRRQQTKADRVTWDDPAIDPNLYDRFIETAIAEALTPDAAWYCWHASRRQAMVESAWERHGAFVHCQVIWVKNRSVPTRTWYLWKHEPCFFGWLRGNRPRRTSRRKLPTVWEIDTLPNGPQRPDHPTPKPLEVFEIPMRQHTREGDVCYEPFAGSGTQVIAAERLGRRCFAVEISPVYCDLIVRRYIAYAGEGSVAPGVADRYRLTEGARS